MPLARIDERRRRVGEPHGLAVRRPLGIDADAIGRPVDPAVHRIATLVVVTGIDLPRPWREQERDLAGAGGTRRPVRRQFDPPARVDLLDSRETEPVHARLIVIAHVGRKDHLQLVER